MSDSLRPHGLYSPWNSPGQNTGVGSLSLLQWIFLTQESNRSLLHCRQILYQLSNQRSPKIRKWGKISLVMTCRDAVMVTSDLKGWCSMSAQRSSATPNPKEKPIALRPPSHDHNSQYPQAIIHFQELLYYLSTGLRVASSHPCRNRCSLLRC